MLNAFFEQMKNILKDEYDDFIKALEEPPCQAMHINTNKDPQHQIAKKFNLEAHPYVKNGYYFNKKVLPLGRLAYHDAGLYYIQEPSAMLVAELADLKPGMSVLDMCAAPGGKSSKAALAIGRDGLLIANDIVASRAKILSENIERFGLSNTIVTNADPKQLASLLPGFFDAVIVDAPCSGEGMFRKLDQAKTTWSMDKVKECAAIQKSLLEYASVLLKDGGTLMYSTCTYEPLENEDQIRNALQNLPLTLEPLDLKPGFCSGIDLEGVIRLYPHHFHGEGHFIAKMKKQETALPASAVYPVKSNLNKNQQALLADFWHKNLNIPVPDHLYASNDHLYALPAPYLNLKGVRILRQGLYLGECKKNRFEPSHSLALSLLPEQALRCYNFSADSIEIKKYLHGETLEGHQGNGFGLILVEGHPLGFVKEVNGTLKNYYPKGLRK